MSETVCKIKSIKSFGRYDVVSCITSLGLTKIRSYYHHSTIHKYVGKIVILTVVTPHLEISKIEEHNKYGCILNILKCNSRMIFEFRRDNDL